MIIHNYDSCVNCLHKNVCAYFTIGMPIENRECDDYSDKLEWVHLPCKAGDTAYLIGYKDICTAKYRTECPLAELGYDIGETADFDNCGEDAAFCDHSKKMAYVTENKHLFYTVENIMHWRHQIGNTIFLTKEEAETKVKEINEGITNG